MSRRTKVDSETGEDGAAETAPRPKPKRKFEFRIGEMVFEKRVTAEDAAKVEETAFGSDVILLLDGKRFRLLTDGKIE